jgi:hypothetical protein
MRIGLIIICICAMRAQLVYFVELTGAARRTGRFLSSLHLPEQISGVRQCLPPQP